MKSLLALLFLNSCTVFSMSDSDKTLKLRTYAKKESSEHPTYKSPMILIADHAKHPDFIFTELKKYPVQELLDFRYALNNTLLHCLVEALITKKDAVENFDKLIEDYKPLFRWLVLMGLSINKVNDHHHTPLILVYIAQDKHDKKLQPLLSFLEHDLQAKTTYFSLEPELRFCKTILWEFLTCQCCKHKYS